MNQKNLAAVKEKEEPRKNLLTKEKIRKNR
jgi:hypothetical protein